MPMSAHLRFAPAHCQRWECSDWVIRETIPSKPNMSWWCPQFVHTNVLIFCIMPSIGTFTFLNKSTPRTASRRAKSCGVETMIAPEHVSSDN